MYTDLLWAVPAILLSVCALVGREVWIKPKSKERSQKTFEESWPSLVDGTIRENE